MTKPKPIINASPGTGSVGAGPTDGSAPHSPVQPAPTAGVKSGGSVQPYGERVAGFKWSGEIHSNKWVNFFMKVLQHLVSDGGLKLTVSIDAAPANGISTQKIDETRVALRELGLHENLEIIKTGGGAK